MRLRRIFTTVCLAITLLLLGAVPAQAAGCVLLGDLLTCPPGTVLDGPGQNPSRPAVPPGAYPAGASRLLQLANQDRAAAGIGPLTSRQDLVSLALDHTLGLVNADSLFHNLDLLGRPLRGLLGASVVGENVGWSTDIDDLHERLMTSPLHRANILDPRFSVVGMAVMSTDDGKFYATQDFAQPDGSAPAPPAPVGPAPAAAAPATDKPSPAPVTPVSQPAPSSTVPSTTVKPAEEPAKVVSPPSTLADLSSVGRNDQARAGDVEGLLSMAPVANERPAERGGAVFLAVALVAAVALADGAWVVRDRRQARS